MNYDDEGGIADANANSSFWMVSKKGKGFETRVLASIFSMRWNVYWTMSYIPRVSSVLLVCSCGWDTVFCTCVPVLGRLGIGNWNMAGRRKARETFPLIYLYIDI